jgi:hypothetical protein
MRHRLLVACLALLAMPAAFAQDSTEQKGLDAQRKALDAERRALDAERRALEAERRAQASQGSSAAADGKRQACQAATASYQLNCSRPSLDPLWETPQCADAKKLMAERCG